MSDHSKNIFKKLSNYLQIKKPNIDSLKSCIVDFGIPDHDRGNLAIKLKDYILEEKFKNKKKSHYDDILNYVLNISDLSDLKKIIHEVADFEVNNLFFWINKRDENWDYYNPFSFLKGLVNNGIIQREELETSYFTEITQVNDQFIVLKCLGSSEDYLFTLDGEFLNNEIQNYINESFDEYAYYELYIVLGDNGKIKVTKEWDEYNWGYFLLDFEGKEISAMEEVDRDYKLENTSNEKTAKEITAMYLEQMNSNLNNE